MLQNLEACFKEKFSALLSIVLPFLLLSLVDHFYIFLFSSKANMAQLYLDPENFQAIIDEEFHVS